MQILPSIVRGEHASTQNFQSLQIHPSLKLAYLHCNFNEYMFHLNQLDVNVDLKKF